MISNLHQCWFLRTDSHLAWDCWLVIIFNPAVSLRRLKRQQQQQQRQYSFSWVVNSDPFHWWMWILKIFKKIKVPEMVIQSDAFEEPPIFLFPKQPFDGCLFTHLWWCHRKFQQNSHDEKCIYSFSFNKCFIVVRVTVNLEAIPGTQGRRFHPR